MPALSNERLKAIEDGLTVYRTGKPCSRGHISERFVSNHSCVECHAISDALFKEKQPERRREIEKQSRKRRYPERRQDILQQNKKWREANKDKVDIANHSYRESHRAEAKQRTSNWQKSNPDKVREQSNRHRVRKIEAEGFHTAQDVECIRAKQNDKCAYCRGELRKKWHLDHIVALSKGGSDWPRNLQLLCRQCNVRKSAKDPIVFAQSIGRLL